MAKSSDGTTDRPWVAFGSREAGFIFDDAQLYLKQTRAKFHAVLSGVEVFA